MDLAQFALASPLVKGVVAAGESAVEVCTTNGGVAEGMDDVTLPTEAPKVQWVAWTPVEGH